MNEEELYSSVARGDAGYEEDSSKLDAVNSATFGEAEAGGVDAEDGDPASSAKGAWGNAGAGVAAVKGSTRCGGVNKDALSSCLLTVIPSFTGMFSQAAVSCCPEPRMWSQTAHPCHHATTSFSPPSRHPLANIQNDSGVCSMSLLRILMRQQRKAC